MNAGAADLAWLPGDADEQLALGLRIVSNSYKNRVQTADTEIRQLKAQLAERGEQVSSLQKKCSALEVQLIEQTQRGNQLVEENKQLIATTRKLQKDIQRLENLKKAVLTSIQEDRPEADDSSPFGSAEAAFPATARRTVAEISSMEDAALKGVRLDFRRAGTAHGTVLTTHEDPSANADGRAFFRAARSRLSFETFNAFLANIKRLNNQQQDREETLRTAERLFGASGDQWSGPVVSCCFAAAAAEPAAQQRTSNFAAASLRCRRSKCRSFRGLQDFADSPRLSLKTDI